MWCETGADLYIPEWARCCKVCPTKIEVLRKPYRKDYEIGEPMDYTGLLVRGYVDDKPWADANHPNGFIPVEDLVLPTTYDGNDVIPVSFYCNSLVSTSFTLSDCPYEIRVTTLPETEYVVDPDHMFPLPVDFTGAVVQAFDKDGNIWDTLYEDGIIPHSELTYEPTEITGGEEDTGAYYLFDGTWQVVNTQADNTGGAVKGPVGERFCAIMNGTDQYIVCGSDTMPFSVEHGTWDGTRELGTANATAYTYNGHTYYITDAMRWYAPAPISTIEYTLRNNQPIKEQAIDIMFGGHLVSDKRLITVSWDSPCGSILTADYEVHVH